MKKLRKFHVTVTHEGELVSYNRKTCDTAMSLFFHLIDCINALVNGATIEIKVEMEVQS